MKITSARAARCPATLPDGEHRAPADAAVDPDPHDALPAVDRVLAPGTYAARYLRQLDKFDFHVFSHAFDTIFASKAGLFVSTEWLLHAHCPRVDRYLSGSDSPRDTLGFLVSFCIHCTG
jgi:hypothetical protein